MCTFGLLPWWLSLQCRRLGFDPWVGKIPWRRVRLSYPLQYSGLKNSTGFPGGLEVKASACNAGDLSSIPGLGRFPGEGNGNPLQYSCLENPMDGGAWWAIVQGVAKSRTQLRNFTFTWGVRLRVHFSYYVFLKQNSHRVFYSHFPSHNDG